MSSILGSRALTVSISGTAIFFLFGVLLNFQRVIGSLNFSLADLLIFPLLAYLIATKTLRLDKGIFAATLYLMLYIVTASAIFVPFQYQVSVEMSSLLVGTIKQSVLFIYLFIGLSLRSSPYEDQVIKGVVIGSFISAIFSILFLISGIPTLRAFVVDSDRLIGFSNDPNFFATVQCAALGLLLFSKTFALSTYRKWAILAITVSVLLTASKSGLLFMTAIYATFIGLTFKHRNLKLLLVVSVVLFLSLIGITSFKDQITQLIPAFERIVRLFENFGYALNADGSSRSAVWNLAINIISSSPFGIGNSAFWVIADRFGGDNLAHNTYLQLAIEWGLINAVVFVFCLLYVLAYSIFTRRQHDAAIVLLVMLMFSMTLSLNNSRLLWFVVGLMVMDHVQVIFDNRQRRLSYGLQESREC